MSTDLIFDTSKDVNGSYIIYGRVADNAGVSKQIGILENGMPLNLTGFTITFEGITHEGKTKVFDTGGVTVVDAAKGTFKYTFPSLAFTVSGKYERAYFSLVKDSVRYTTADFEIVVFENADIDAEEAETIITEYNKLIAELYALQKSNIAELQKQQDEYIKTTDTTFAAINQKITALQTQITSYETSVTNSKDTAINTINAALEEFKAGDFYTKSESDSKFMLLKSAERSLITLKNAVVTVEDWNTLTTTGVFYCAGATGPNKPYTGTLYGYLTIYNTLAVIIQKYEFGPNVYMRTFAGNPATWGSWIKKANANEVVDLTEPQVIGGIKDFSETPTVKGKEVLVNSKPLPYEVWLGPGGEQTSVPNKARLKFGPDMMTIETKMGREMKPSPLSWNNDRWLASITRDCQLFFEGQCRLQPNSSSGAYAYLTAYRGANEGEDQIGFFGGRGSTAGAGAMNYKQSVPLSGVITFKAGDHFALSLEMADGKTMAFTQINHMHIMEIV